jgi:ribonucleoside-diphosphate reductase alpha chain
MFRLKIQKIFTKNCCDAYDNIKFKNAQSVLKNLDGSVAKESAELIVPEHWSSIAIDVLARNYIRKKGISKHLKKVYEIGIPEWLQRSEPDTTHKYEDTQETDSRKVFDRLAGTWTYWGFKEGYFDSEQDARNYFDEMRYMLAMQYGAPNSPQWFNTGLHWAYGIAGAPQGHYYFDEIMQTIKQSQSAYERPQPHACFIQSVKDDLVNEGGIMDLFVKEARVFKYGSGSGTNFSNIRGAGESLSGGGVSSGLISFLRIGDTIGGCIQSGGTTRRAAKMVIVDIDHPDIEDFIKWKMNEEGKVIDFVVGSRILSNYAKQLISNYNDKEKLRNVIESNKECIPETYTLRVLSMLESDWIIDTTETDMHWETGAYRNVFGQNSNNSVRVNDAFLNAIENNQEFNLINRCDGKIAKTVKAKDLWSQIAKASWACADPGVQYDTTINSWNTCANDDRIKASNPCSEYMFLDDTACNLASLNLSKFLDDDEQFNIENFKHACELWTITLELSIVMAQLNSPVMAQKTHDYRTLGLGYGNLGNLLIQLGIAYNSAEGRNTAAAITSLMQATAYATSVKLAKCKGPFTRYYANKEPMMRIMRNHARASGVEELGSYESLNIAPPKLNPQLCKIPYIAEESQKTWRRALSEGEKYGFRNAQTTLIAPTGTIGMIMDFKTTGIEPQFAQVTLKQLAGGGYWKMINANLIKALKKLGYSEIQIQEINHYVVGEGKFKTTFENWLRQVGFDNQSIENVNASLKTAISISNIFSPKILGTELMNKFGIAKEEYEKSDFNLLQRLGAKQSEIEEMDHYVCGHMTFEGAPHLRPEHLPVFDCAVAGGSGTRSISYQGHLKMMAAVQPFLSGAISKTVNLPWDVTPQDFENVHMLAWELGLKSVAVYRDNSKYSQAITTKSKKCLDKFLQTQPPIAAEQHSNATSIQPRNDSFKPFRSRGYTQHVLIGESSLWHTTGEDENGQLRNVLLTYGKEGGNLRGWAGAWGRILSMYLQEKGDTALLHVYKAFRHSKFEPLGTVIGHPSIKHATSIPDYIVEDLAQAYPNMLNCTLPKSVLPPQRKGIINKLKIGDETMYLIIGEYQDKPYEIFVTGVGNEGSDLRGWMNSCAKLLSLYMQSCPETAAWNFINAFENSSFEPSGFVEGSKYIRLARSPLDLLAKYLKHHYYNTLGKEQVLLNLDFNEKQPVNSLKSEQKLDEEAINLMNGYKIDESCRICRAFKLRYNGSCYICDNCFTTTGCSS